MLPSLLWLLMIYEMHLTTVEGIKRQVNSPPPWVVSSGVLHQVQSTAASLIIPYHSSWRNSRWKSAGLRCCFRLTTRWQVQESPQELDTKAYPRQRINMVQAEVRQLEEEGSVSRATELGSEGTWIKWDLQSRRLVGPDLGAWSLSDAGTLPSVYDTFHHQKPV